MARPKILGETKRPVEESPPPPASALRPHKWLSRSSLDEFEKVLGSGEPFEVYLSDLAERKIMEHAESEAPRRLEVMGFLLGYVNAHAGGVYSVVRDVVTTELRSSSSKVRFDPEAFPKLFVGLDGSGFDYILVGWYHSHPGHTCFLSRTDLVTQRTIFNQPYHAALVVDPINRDVKTFKLVGEGYVEVPFAIFTGGHSPRKSPRTRKVRVTPGEAV